jgi:hypothetical protein
MNSNPSSTSRADASPDGFSPVQTRRRGDAAERRPGPGGDATSADELRASPLVRAGTGYHGPERRSNPRIPKSLEISVQPLDEKLVERGQPFFAITRDISQGGLAYLSSREAGCERALIKLNDGIGPAIVCRICNDSLLHCAGLDKVWLTNVQFLHVDRRHRS